MSQRDPKPYEICLSDKSLTGVHQWNIETRLQFDEAFTRVKNKSKKVPYVVCKICKDQPPINRRGIIMRDIEAQLESQREVNRIRRLYRPVKKRR